MGFAIPRMLHARLTMLWEIAPLVSELTIFSKENASSQHLVLIPCAMTMSMDIARNARPTISSGTSNAVKLTLTAFPSISKTVSARSVISRCSHQDPTASDLAVKFI